MTRKCVFSVVARVLLAAVPVLVTANVSRAEANPKWEVEGHYAEACQCNVPCPCNFGQKPTHGNCDNTSVYQIEKGRYGEERLDGLNVIVVASSPEGERYVDAVGALTFARIYVDKRANEKQQKALEEIARALNASYMRLPSLKLSADEEVKAVPIQVTIGAHGADATIPGVLDFHTKRLMGADEKEPIEIVNGSVVVEWMPRIWAGQSETYKYSDAQDWDYGGRSAYFANFKAHSDMASIRPSTASAGD